MAAPQRVVQAVEAAIVASAHLSTLELVTSATEACERLGRLTSGRWRSAARDLGEMEQELRTSLNSAVETLNSRASDLGIPDEALWSVGDAAATFDALREPALDLLEDDDRHAAHLLEGKTLFGTSFLEDPELPDRGTTLLFGWSDPLSPATWPWQANWVVGDAQDGESSDETEELDLFEAGELEGDGPHLADLAAELSCSEDEARAALRAAAVALTRASLLAALDEGDDDEDEEDDEEDDDV